MAGIRFLKLLQSRHPETRGHGRAAVAAVAAAARVHVCAGGGA